MASQSGADHKDEGTFTLLNFSHPSEAASRVHKKKVRSHATQHQHRERRKTAGPKTEVAVKPPLRRPRPARPYEVLRTRLDSADPSTVNSENQSQQAINLPCSQHQATPATGGQSLEFVTWSNPDQVKTPSIRKKIRAHAGKASHPSSVRKKASDGGTTPSFKGPKTEDEQCRISSTRDLGMLNVELERLNSWPGLRRTNSCGVSQETYGFAIARSSQYVSNLVLHDRTHHIGKVLDRMGCTIELAMDHFLFIVFSQIPGLEANYKLSSKGRDARVQRFMPFILSEPALALIALLLAVVKYLGNSKLEQYASELSALKYAVVSAINEALGDGDRGTSDAVIYSVTLLSSLCAFMGYKDEWQVHMQGLEKMVRLRGGLQTLGLDGMLAKLLLWSVSNCAFFLKVKPAFTDFGVELPKPSIYYFFSQMIESEVAPILQEQSKEDSRIEEA